MIERTQNDESAPETSCDSPRHERTGRAAQIALMERVGKSWSKGERRTGLGGESRHVGIDRVVDIACGALVAVGIRRELTSSRLPVAVQCELPGLSVVAVPV